MKRIVRMLALLALAAFADPACAQREGHSRTVMSSEHNGHRREIEIRGRAAVNEAGDWVESVSDGGRMVIEEDDGRTERRAEFVRGDGGGVAVRYFVEGRERALDGEGRAWIQASIRRAVREDGFGAQERVARIRARSGVAGVLREVAALRGDVARRAYYTALFAGDPLSAGETRQVLADVDERMTNDVERRIVLTSALAEGGAAAVEPVLEAATALDSDVESRIVLTSAVERGWPRGEGRAAFYRAIGRLESDVERRIVLTTALERGAEADAAFFAVVEEMRSDVERRIVLTHLLDGSPSRAESLGALEAAARMRSDVEKRIVLTQVDGAQLRDPRVSAAYRRVVEGMQSDSERSIALRHLSAEG